MKNIKLTALIAMISFASCKKNDLQDISAQNPLTNSEFLSQKTSLSFSDWESVNNWSAEKKNTFTEYSTTFSDSLITSNIASDGLVLLFAKTGGTFQNLPCTQRNIELYYQVSTGTVLLIAKAVNQAAIDNKLQFSHIVFSKGQLKELEKKNISKLDLMQANYEKLKKMIE